MLGRVFPSFLIHPSRQWEQRMFKGDGDWSDYFVDISGNMSTEVQSKMYHAADRGSMPKAII